MIKSILLAVDGSVYSDAQVKHCVQLAQAFEARVFVLTVVDVRFFEWAISMGTEGFVPVIPSAVYQEESKKMLEAKADAVLEKCVGIIGKKKLSFETEKIHGPPADIICEKSYLVDLLIMGARGEFAKWKTKLGGATLQAVVRECNKPIFISTEAYKKITKLLIAYDGSDKANKALQLGGYFGAKLNVPISILSVSDSEPKRNKVLQDAKIYLKPYDVDVELVGVDGSPEKRIVEISEKNRCDVIVMGAFGHTRIMEAILGSTTEQIMRTSKIPILLAK